MKPVLCIIAMLLPGLIYAASPEPSTQQEITHLFTYLKNSGCSFNRNGNWYTAEQAVDHLNKKYEYLQNKGLVSSAENFIDRAASESSMSGKAYLVRCGKNTPVPSATWFKTELSHYRTKPK